jgi:anti-sigma factor RsiW
MMKDPQFERLREVSWRRKLTPAEQETLAAWLTAHPDDQPEWDSEAALNEWLTRLPDVPVSNNFTARVLASAQRDAAQAERTRVSPGRLTSWCRQWLPKAAVAAIVLGAGLLSYNHLQEEHRAEVARSVATVSSIPAVQSPDILKDFDAIAAMSSTPVADEELLKVMQ